MDVRLLLFLFLFVSCVPQSEGPRTNVAKSAGNTTGSSTGGFTESPTATQTSWNYLGGKSQNISINNSNLNTAYLIGSLVESFLNNSINFSGANYCLVGNFSLGGVVYQLRSRIVPVSYYDYQLKRNVKVLRVDFPDAENSQSFCSAPLRVLNSAGTYVTEASPTPKFEPSLLCPSCTSTLNSTKVRLFRKNLQLDEVPVTQLNLNSLSFSVDPNNNSSGGNGSCSNSACLARGFDCCLDNQCVNDGSIKDAARTQYSSQLDTAEAERNQNPLAYLNYPHLYYICGTTVPTTSGGTGGGGTGYDEKFEALKKDLLCIEELKAKATITPFQSELFSRTYSGYTNCVTGAGNESNTLFYTSVIKRMYQTCGCSKTDLQEMVTSCPAYDYVVRASDSSGPTQIDCYTPPTETAPLPTQLTVTVNSRSAPHRFFDGTGTERDLSVASSGFEQEGDDKFEYLDDGGLIPKQDPYSMKAILGQMSVSLNHAMPAKVVNVELDQVYLISTTSGFYTPCPTCTKDSWLNSFTAFPSSSMGIGHQAIGYSTSRDTFSSNNTGGNYEDTIFGRACWLPPTMIPFGHSSKSSVSTQRINRLKTQSALFANGYQRDWFGFNKGAMIGSFDGVSWFAIGKGRIVKSSSKKLFLAINAPFADLANPSLNVVNIEAYNGITKAAQVDYTPELHHSDVEQNQAGSCQANHVCETDTDCVTRLGWEYMCSDVKSISTAWPKFDTDAKEQAATSEVKTLDQILQQKRFPTSDTKRCVYRGAGAPCIVNSGTITDLSLKKNLTCAPNFFCANVNSAGVFNNKISRYAASLQDLPVSRNHLYGQDAHVTGRPFSYISSNDTVTLESNIAQTIRENLQTNTSLASTNSGLCRPGKAVPEKTNQATLSNPFTQHMFADPTRRTDFISQIGGCNSTLFQSDNRHTSCPVIDKTSGNYTMFTAAGVPSNYNLLARNQNACGLESLHTSASLSSSADTLSSFSPFRNIEARPLNSQIIINPTLARDACLRRAGQVCHTDLDCSPNKMHAEQVDSFSISYFGNQAEKNYYSEYLTCGQTDPQPAIADTLDYKDYKMAKNVCCREVGKDITTFTSDVPTATAQGNYLADSAGLKMSLAPGFDPKDPKRYSRLATVDGLGTTKPTLSAFQNRDLAGVLTAGTTGNVMTPNQWKSLGEANSNTCCGGGWVRKFSDGSNNWSKRDRVFIDVNNFKCLNARTMLITDPIKVEGEYATMPVTDSAQTLVQQDFGDYCKDSVGVKGSCAQYSFPDSIQDLASALDPFGTVTVNTVSPKFTLASNLDYYFAPRSADSNSSIFIDYSVTSGRRYLSLKVPSYITTNSFYGGVPGAAGVPITMKTDNADNTATCNPTAAVASLNDPSASAATVNATCAAGTCCYNFDINTRVLKVVANTVPAFNNRRVGVEFVAQAAGAATPSIVRKKPRSSSYYLRRLGRLELSGIPQISHEALYCSNDSDLLIPGIFAPAVTTRSQLESDVNFSYRTSAAPSIFYTNQFGLANEPIFSANEYKCCTPLGKTNTDQRKCCSGFGVAQGGTSTKFTCALPPGTDLMVYFNRFVSNEGRGSEQPGGGLIDADFDSLTGEPSTDPLKMTSVIQKISDLGTSFCASGRIRQGGAFGAFEPEPQGPDTNLSSRVYNIVDSTRDVGTNSNAGRTISTGYPAFMDGFRWNHHLYCDD